MRFYLAGRIGRRDELNRYADQLRQRGHEVDCRWLQGLHQLHPNAALVDQKENEEVPLEARPFAQDDVEDVSQADAIILFSERAGMVNRGGRHVEFGLAIALRKRLVVVGPRENLFHCLPQVERFESWQEFLQSGI